MVTVNSSRLGKYGIHALLLLVIFGGCQKMGLSKPSHQWTCDEKADAALQKGDLESGILLHQHILKKDPHNALALYHLGYAYGRTGDHQLEVDCYEKAVSEGYDQDADLFYNLGMAYGELNRVPSAISAFKTAVGLNPEGNEYHFGLALAYKADSDVRSAELEFLKAIEIDPQDVAARWEVSLLYVHSGNLSKARCHLRKILEMDPSHQAARALFNRIEKE